LPDRHLTRVHTATGGNRPHGDAVALEFAAQPQAFAAPHEVPVAEDQKGPPVLREHFAPNDVFLVIPVRPRCGAQFVARVDRFPVDGRIAEQHAQFPAGRQRGIDRADRVKELSIDGPLPAGIDVRRVFPHVPKRLIVDRVAANESIHELLVPPAAELDHDIVDDGAESRVANQREAKTVSLDVAVGPFAESHQSMRPEGLDDAADGFDRDRGFGLILRPAWQENEP
jgi:hypothetical protein